jgi:hypothetical protein
MTSRHAVTAARNSLSANKKQVAKLLAAIIGILTALSGGGYIIRQNYQSGANADTNQVFITTDVLKGYVQRGEFSAAQEIQAGRDLQIVQHLGYVEQTVGKLDIRVEKLQDSANENTALLHEIKGKVGSKDLP